MKRLRAKVFVAPKIDLENDHLLCPFNGGDVQRLIAARWRVLIPPEVIKKWSRIGLYLGGHKQYYGKMRRENLLFPAKHWRRYLVTSSEAVIRFMERAEEIQLQMKLDANRKPVKDLSPWLPDWRERVEAIAADIYDRVLGSANRPKDVP